VDVDHLADLCRQNAEANDRLAKDFGPSEPKHWFHRGQAKAYRRCARRLLNLEDAA
jgi:hypothetical protein